jgi:hypothetical protein
MVKVISTRDVVFDEDTVFDRKIKDIMNNLMHNTLEEIATWVKTVELPRANSWRLKPSMKMTLHKKILRARDKPNTTKGER